MDKLIIVSAPSGAGKTTLVQHLLSEFPENLRFSVSCTTRPKREYETEGKDYYFLNPESFKEKINQNDFIEWEEVYPDRFSGTLKSELDRIWKDNKTIIFDVDVEGGVKLKQLYPNALSLFIAPPNLNTLKQRLINRGSETHETLETRVNKAEEEMKLSPRFDSIIINDDLKTAKQEISKLVQSYLDVKEN